MAPEDRPAAEHLSYVAAAAEEAGRWGLFPLLRGAEARARSLPRVGRSRLPSQDIVELAQAPSMDFPETTLQRIDMHHGRPRVQGHWLGLTGPMGPLPIHLTEFAYYESRYAKSRPFGRFLDLLAGRTLQLFYRAWADSQPAAIADRSNDDRFAHYLAMLSGAAEGVGADAAFPPRARLHYAALYVSRRSAGAVEDAVSHLLRQPVRLLEFQPRWRSIEPEDRSVLGQRHVGLGSSAVLGSRVRSASDAFRIMIRARTMQEYAELLPSGSRFRIVAEALDGFKPGHLEWDIAIEIAEQATSGACINGRSQLGWSTWLQPQRSAKVRADAHLRRSAAKRSNIRRRESS